MIVNVPFNSETNGAVVRAESSDVRTRPLT